MLRDRLLDLYGARQGERTAEELEGLLARFRPRLAGRDPGGRNGEGNDALLITYGDTLLGTAETPLAALRAFDAFPMTHHVECVALLVPA